MPDRRAMRSRCSSSLADIDSAVIPDDKLTVIDLKSSPPAVLAGALVFAVHPVQADAVSYAAGRRDVLCGLFFLSAVLAYLKAVEKSESDLHTEFRPGAEKRVRTLVVEGTELRVEEASEWKCQRTSVSMAPTSAMQAISALRTPS